MTSMGAEVIFHEAETRNLGPEGLRFLSVWAVYPRHPEVRDTVNGHSIPGTRVLTTLHELADGTFGWKTRGAKPGGNRYHYAETFEDAQARIMAWAKRRFRYDYEEQA